MNDETGPLAAERDFFGALESGDTVALEKLLMDDFLLIDLMSGSEVPKKSFLDILRSGQLRFERILPAETRVRIYGSVAVVTGRTSMSGKMGHTPFAAASRYTHVYARLGDRWRMVSAQGTRVADP